MTSIWNETLERTGLPAETIRLVIGVPESRTRHWERGGAITRRDATALGLLLSAANAIGIADPAETAAALTRANGDVPSVLGVIARTLGARPRISAPVGDASDLMG